MKILLAGETFSATTSVASGTEVLTSAAYVNGAVAFNAALAAEGISRSPRSAANAARPNSPTTSKRWRPIALW